LSETADSAPLSAERELFLGIQHDRLRRRARWGGVALFLSPLIPYELVDGTPQFLWQILGELPPAALVSAFSLSLCGIAIFVAALLSKRAGTLASIVVAALLTALVVAQLGADRAAWDVLPLPESLIDRPITMLLGLALAGAGVQLAFKPHTRKVARVFLISSLVCTLFFYVIPSNGEAPVVSIFRLAIALPFLPGFRFMLGFGLILIVLHFPAFVALLGLVFAISPPRNEPRVIGRIITFGFPAVLAFFVFRSLLVSFGDASLPGTLGSVVVLAALLGTSSAALETLGEVVASGGVDVSGVPGWPLRRIAIACGAASFVLLGTQLVLARPPKKGINWKLAAAKPEHDRLFGELLGSWSTTRSRWDRRLREGSGAQELALLKSAERKLKEGADGADPGVKSSLVSLVLDSRDLDLAGRRWHRLVSDVNEANRLAGYPYYVDPTLSIIETKDGLDRRFALASYRIEAVHPVQMSGKEFATLHVRRLAGSSGHDNLMGFSRDVQPFALVVLDEIEPLEKELAQTAKLDPPACDAGLVRGAAALGCGRALSAIMQSGRLRASLIAGTERHELQHQFDGPHLPVASAVMDRLGGYVPAVRDRVNRELSAYIAEMTAREAPAVLGLTALFRFSRAPYGHFLHHVAVLGVSALAGRDAETDLEAAFVELFALDDDQLRERVNTAWKRLYGRRLPQVTHP
jgi:hypothetical protein